METNLRLDREDRNQDGLQASHRNKTARNRQPAAPGKGKGKGGGEEEKQSGKGDAQAKKEKGKGKGKGGRSGASTPGGH